MKSSRVVNRCAVIFLLMLTSSAALSERKELGAKRTRRSDDVHWPTVVQKLTYSIHTLLAKVTTLENRLKTIVCSDIDECSSSPCQNGGSCQDQVNAYTCTCAAGYIGDDCQTEIHAVLNDGSVLLFRVTPGINQSAYHRFTAIGDNDDNTPERLQAVPAGCKTTDGSLPCDRHYRSRLLDQSPLSFKTIRVGVYKDGGEQAFFEFNTKGADYMNWFRRERILTSSYTDNPTPTAGTFFSIEGDDRFDRRFFINHSYAGCDSDFGWLVVVDKSDPPCPWERKQDNSYPSVFYNAGAYYRNWNNDGRTMADTLVISGRMDTSSPASPAH